MTDMLWKTEDLIARLNHLASRPYEGVRMVVTHGHPTLMDRLKEWVGLGVPAYQVQYTASALDGEKIGTLQVYRDRARLTYSTGTTRTYLPTYAEVEDDWVALLRVGQVLAGSPALMTSMSLLEVFRQMKDHVRTSLEEPEALSLVRARLGVDLRQRRHGIDRACVSVYVDARDLPSLRTMYGVDLPSAGGVVPLLVGLTGNPHDPAVTMAPDLSAPPYNPQHA